MEKCTYPGCGYIGNFISKTHCKLVHQMDREELFEKYGHPNKYKNRMKDIVIGDGKGFKRRVRGINE